MRIAFCIRPDYNKPLGGDAIQMLKTKEFLEKNYDITIDIITEPKEISKVFEIVHVFNFSTYKISRKFIQQAVDCNIPVVSSSIYWDYSYSSTTKLYYLFPFINHLDEFTINIFRKIMQIIGNILPKPDVVSSVFKRNARWMFDNSDIIAPNSIEEANLLMKWIEVDNSKKIRVVYNATDLTGSQSAIDNKLFQEKYRIPKDFILQVGRIEFCKNQLNLIVALRNNPEIPVVFVGKIVDKLYYNKLKQIANKRGNVFFINAVDHNEINSFFKYAKLHVLLSLRESPGLVNIEALSNGCPIVISDERFLPVKTYFENQPYIVNPLNIKNIKEVVLDAYKNKKIAPFDFTKFSWETTSSQTYKIYKEIIKN